MREWRFGVGYGRDRSWHGQLNAEGIAAPPSPKCCSTLRHDDAIGSKWSAVTKVVAGRGFNDTAVIVHLTVYQPTRIALRVEGLFQKRCHEQRNHVHARCASAPVSCHLSPPFSILSSPLLFLATVFHLAFSPSLSPLCSRTRPPDTAYISSIVRSPAICP